jgi:Ni,Fe-hydrogenase III large subunit
MGAPEPMLNVAADHGRLGSLRALREACATRLSAGDRLLALFGRTAAAGQVRVTAVLQTADGALDIIRAEAMQGQSYQSLTPDHPSAHLFERELWEQTGVVPDGHPWLKPVRYEGERQQRMDQHAFFSVRGQDVHEVGVGPIHASVIEPGHFRFMCLGETVHHLEIQLGYQHRGVEALLLARPPLTLTPLVETIAGDTSVAYAWAYCAALESLTGTSVSPEVELVRGVALELERIAMHLVGLTGLATDIAFLQGGATYGRLRTAIINASMRACGSRFGRGWLRPGGVRFGLDAARRGDLIETLTAFSRDLHQVNDLTLSARSVRSRFQGIGAISAATAADIGMVGFAARASGVARDLRVERPGRMHRDWPLALRTEPDGDCWARLRLRMTEIDESLAWLGRVLSAPDLDRPLAPAVMGGPLAPERLCVSLREGWRGPVLQVYETSADARLCHVKIQDPSMTNWFGLALALRDNQISDFPLCNKSFDLSYCGNDL